MAYVKLLLFTEKPSNVDEFLKPLVDELNTLFQYGLLVNSIEVKFVLRCFICDTPARAMIRGMFCYTDSYMMQLNLQEFLITTRRHWLQRLLFVLEMHNRRRIFV